MEKINLIKRIIFSVFLVLCISNPVWSADGERVVEGIRADNIDTVNLDATGNVVVQTATDSTTAVQVLDKDGTVTASFDNVNNRVGIGTDAPARPLEVYVSGDTAQMRITGGQDGNALIELYADEGDNNPDKWDIISKASMNDLQFRSNGIEKMLITYSGNVGIATTVPDYSLDINHATGDNLKLIYNDSDGSATDYSTFQTAADGALTITTVDADAAEGHIALMPDGNVGIGTDAPGAAVDISYGGYAGIGALKIGADIGDLFTRTDATAKFGIISLPHYRNAEQSILLLSSYANATTSTINIGGSDNNWNAATRVRFWTAADNTTITGTERMRIDSSGNVGIGTTAPDAALEVNHATGDNLRLTYNDGDGSATNYADFQMSSGGDLSINASGGSIDFNGNYATQLQNIPDMASGGASLHFDGVDDSVTIITAATIQDIFDNGGSIIAFGNPSSDGENSQGTMVGVVNNDFLFDIRNESAGFVDVQFEHAFSGDNGKWLTTSTAAPISANSVFGVVYDGSSLSNDPVIYVNGESFGLTESITPTGTIDPSDDNWIIGNNGIGTRTWDGELSKTLVFNLALTQAEVQALSSGGAVPFKYVGASQTELITDSDNTDFDDGTINEWVGDTNGNGTVTYSAGPGAEKTGLITIGGTPGTITRAYLPTGDVTTYQVGKAYRITADVYIPSANNNFTEVHAKTNNIDVAVLNNDNYAANLSNEDAWQTLTYEFTISGSDVTGWAVQLWTASTTTGDLCYFDNISVTQIGCVLDLNPSGITDTKWVDASGNDLDGTVSGAVVTNPMPNLYVAEQDGTVKIMTDESGNVGIGNSSLESWFANWTALQLGGNAALMTETTPAASNGVYLGQNVYYNASGTWSYISTDEAATYGMNNGKHIFRTATSGTADNPITWITAQTITAAGLSQFGTAAGAGQVNITPGSAIDGLYIDNDYTAHGINVIQDGVLAAFQSGLSVYTNTSQTTGRALATLKQDNTGSTIPTLFIDHDGTGGAAGYALHIDSENAAGPAIYVEAADIGVSIAGSGDWPLKTAGKYGIKVDATVNDGKGMEIYSDLGADDDTSPLVVFHHDNAANTMPTFSLQNDGSGPHITTGATDEDLEIDPNGTGGTVLKGGAFVVSYETVTCVTEAGTASLSTVASFIVSDGDADTDEDTVSLADGVAGQIKKFTFMTDTDTGDSVNITPTNFKNGTKIVFDTEGEGCEMLFDGTNWNLQSHYGGVIS